MKLSKRGWGGIILLMLLSGGLWLTTTQHEMVWPVRNTLTYHALTGWWSWMGQPHTGQSTGTMQGTVYDEQGQPLAGAWVLLSTWDGRTFSDLSGPAGAYHITEVPSGWYRPIAAAPGYGNRWLEAVEIRSQAETGVDVELSPETISAVSPGRNLTVGRSKPLSCRQPIPKTARRQTVYFESEGHPNQLTLLYTPEQATLTSTFPVLLTIYPGPADSWECASIPLAAAGYTVIAVGPAYSFDVEGQLDELERILNFVQAGDLPQADPDQIGLLGGSFSSIHVQRLIQRRQDVQAAVLLGPPTDMFDMRRRFENGSISPPFGLDQVMLAAGLPHQDTMRYWQYSGVYHARPDYPPLALLHSRSDAVIPFQQTELLADSLDKVGAPYEIHLFEGAGHYLLSDDGIEVYRIVVDFLERQFEDG